MTCNLIELQSMLGDSLFDRMICKEIELMHRNLKQAYCNRHIDLMLDVRKLFGIYVFEFRSELKEKIR